MRYEFTGEMLDEVLADAEKRGGEVDKWYAFPQGWGDTSIGFGGMAGQTVTSAQTIVVFSWEGVAFVYIGGRFGYEVARPREEFWDRLHKHNMPSVHMVLASRMARDASEGEAGTIVGDERKD